MRGLLPKRKVGDYEIESIEGAALGQVAQNETIVTG